MVDEGLLRMITALGHGVSGVTLTLRCHGGEELVVAANRLDAHLDPCQLRAAMLVPPRPGVSRLIDTIAAVDVHLGLEDLGGGLYRRGGPDGEERWFATLLGPAALGDLLDSCAVDVPDESMTASLEADEELGATAVCITANHPAASRHLDAVASWALAVCMVEELLGASRRELSR
jgi:hypothetical protein